MSNFKDTFGYTPEDLMLVAKFNDLLAGVFYGETFRITICSLLAFMDKVTDIECKKSMLSMVEMYVEAWKKDLEIDTNNKELN
jgi:hypothetical protein